MSALPLKPVWLTGDVSFVNELALIYISDYIIVDVCDAVTL